MSIEKHPGQKWSRKNFLRFGAAGIGGLFLANSGLYGLFINDEPVTLPQVQGFHQHTDFNYPAVAWVRDNLIIAAERIKGQNIVSPGTTFSLLNAVTTAKEKTDQLHNFDPAMGLVSGVDLASASFQFGSGLCKVATDIFRCAMMSPVVITESHTHNSIYPGHPYFTNYSYGTDAAVYFDENIEYDLRVVNPFSFPIILDYSLYDENGIPITPEDKTDITPLTVIVGGIDKIHQGMREVEIPMPKGIFPNLIAETPINTSVVFAAQYSNEVIPQWRIELTGPTETDDGQFEIRRKLYIENKLIQNYCRRSNYVH